MKLRLDIEATNTKAFKTENCVSHVYITEAYMVAHKIFSYMNGIDINGIAYIHHGVKSGLQQRGVSGLYGCGKPGGVIQSLCGKDGNKEINPQNQFGDVYDQEIKLTLIVDIDDDQFDDSEMDNTDIKKLLLTSRIAGGSIIDANVSEFDGDIKHGWVVIDRSDIVRKHGRFDSLIKINTGELQDAEMDERELDHAPMLSVSNIGYQILAPGEISPDNQTMHCHETVLGVVEMVHFKNAVIEECFWKWNNIGDFFLLIN